MQHHIVTQKNDTDALFDCSSAAMAPRLGELTVRQISAGLNTAAGASAKLAAHNAFIAHPSLRVGVTR